MLIRNNEAKRFDVVIKVISKKGRCDNGHKIGDEWVINTKTAEGICLWAFNALYPVAEALMSGGSFPWEEDPEVAYIDCPDRDNTRVFELRRLGEIAATSSK